MAGIQLTGLSSGLDTDAIIAQLLAAEGRGRSRIVLQQASSSARETDLSSIRSRLVTLGTTASALSSAATWTTKQAVTSSSESTLGAALTGSAVPGSYQVDVSRLAVADQRSYTVRSLPSTSTITVGGKDVTLPARATADQAAALVNESGGTVYAVAVDGKLVIGARETGAASSAQASGFVLTEDTGARRAGADAQYTINGGVTRTSARNVVTDGLGGVELTLRATGSSRVDVTVPSVDADAVVAKVKAFVDAYNTVLGQLRSETTEKRVPGATTAADAAKGVLFGDGGLRSLATSLRSGVDLSSIGVSTGAATPTATADALAGRLVLDESALRAALAKSGGTEAVRSQLSATATRLAATLDPQTASGGLLDGRLDAVRRARSAQSDALERFDARVAGREEALRKQFTALESVLSRSKSLQAQLFGTS